MENKKKVGIVAECVCDLPMDILTEYDISVLFFLIETENGVFTDTDEITAKNVIEHMESGGKRTKSSAPTPQVYLEMFREKLKTYEEVVLVTISSRISHSLVNAGQARELMGEEGKKVHVFDSMHLSTGLGLLVLRAAQLAEQGHDAESIVKELENLRPYVVTSFLTKGTNYLYRNGLVSGAVNRLCTALGIHPVLTMKDGYIKLKGIMFGNYEKASMNYTRRILGNKGDIDGKLCFVTQVACSVNLLNKITAEVEKQYPFERIRVTNASATISSNCGEGTFGVLYMKKTNR